MHASSSGQTTDEAHVRNSLTAASQPLPPEGSAQLDAGNVDERHITISSSSALEEAVQSENIAALSPASLEPQGQSSNVGQAAQDATLAKEHSTGGVIDKQPTEATSAAALATATDLFSDLDVQSGGS